jgi:DNA repair protein RecN (Recombination protein N)
VLEKLTIRDFGIIERLEWSPTAGLNVLTGETGAGKSLVLDALDVLTGRRVGQEVIRAGADLAALEAEFSVPASGPARDAFSEAGCEGSTVVLSREIERNGRGVATMNNRTVPVRTLRDLAVHLFDVHGPNQQFALLDPREQLLLLDAFGELHEGRNEFAVAAARLRETRKRIDSVATDKRELARRRDMLAFEVGEIRKADIKPDEEAALLEETSLLSNVERLREAVSLAFEDLQGGDQAAPSGTDRIAEAVRRVTEAAAMDQRLTPLADALESALYQLEDSSRELSSYRDSLEYDPRRHEEVETRLDLIRSLKRKYGDSVEAVLAYADRAEEELASLDRGEENREYLLQLEQDESREVARLGQMLSSRRREVAARLSAAVETELSDLNMSGTGFMVSFRTSEGGDMVELDDGSACAFSSTGIDDIEFLIRPNPGEPFMPLSRTASTGETSRLMLAVRCALARGDRVPTLVFDEIDIGVGGRSGEVIGRKLAGLAVDRQVVCITHLPQVAAYGESQFSVQKKVVHDRTLVELRGLTGDAREGELSDMLGSLGEPSLVGARELLARAKAWKTTLKQRTPGARPA